MLTVHFFLALLCLSRCSGSKLDSLLKISKQGTGEVNGKRRVSRDADLPSITVEIAAYVDQDYNAYLEANGLTTLEQKLNAMVLKYTSSTALYGLREQLGISVNMSLKYLEIWPTNPSWYVLSENLQTTRTSFCHNVTHSADVIVLHTKQDQGDSQVKGVAGVGGACDNQRKCAVVNTGLLPAVILAHEIGHLLGMVHNTNSDCDGYSKENGIMESNMLRWNECNAVLMSQTIGTLNCLAQDDVTSTADTTSTSMYANIEFNGKLAGQLYSDDQICEMMAGPGAWLRTYPRSRTYCGPITCARHTENGILLLKSSSYIPGRYCGSDGTSPKICYKLHDKCEAVTNTSLLYTNVIPGGWSDYSDWSSCSVTCGAGIQFRKRDCTNPVPQNSPFCDGSQYDLRTCTANVPDCPGDSISVDLAQVRQTTCANFGETVDHTVSIKTSGHGQCEVTCSTNTALLPDGTPCSGSGIKYCVQGYCEDFSAALSVSEHIDYTKPGQGQREIIAQIPTGATDVIFEFTWADMKKNYLEIWTKDNVKVLSPVSQALYNTGDNPVNFASSYWSFDSKIQSLRSEPGLELTEPAFIKIHQKGDAENAGIRYSFVEPSNDLCTGSCSNGGTWNDTLCSCVCLNGYYGQTCASTCGVYCFNGYAVDSSCDCMCDASVTYGDNCRCQYAFTGKDCTECRESTNLITNNCRRTCQAGCGGLDCKDPCADSLSSCASKHADGHCSYFKAEKGCQLTCDYCEPSTTTVDCSGS